MLCPSCNAFRPTTTGPCPQCSAPSPLVGNKRGGNSALSLLTRWGGPMSPSPLPAPDGDWRNQAQPPSFGVGANDNSLWAQVMAPEAQAQAMSSSAALQRPSLLPVPYQGETGVLQPSFAPMSPDAGLPAIQQAGWDEGGALIPA